MKGTEVYYVGLDVHKKIIAYCVKKVDGTIVEEGTFPATRTALNQWARSLPGPWKGALEATLFTGWIYEALKPKAVELQVAHPQKLKAITTAKKKRDREDARILADLLRCNLIPQCYMAPEEMRELRRILRYRNLLVQESTRFKNRTSGLLMETGVEYNKEKLHGQNYFSGLMKQLDWLPESVLDLLKHSRASLEFFQASEKRLIHGLENHPVLKQRVELLMSIDGVGIITALTWALEICDPGRFANLKQVQSYSGLCSRHHESAGKVQHGPLSKQRNAALQSVLIEAAKLAPQHNTHLAMVHLKALARGLSRNEATLVVARKLASYLWSVDKNKKPFVLKTE